MDVCVYYSGCSTYYKTAAVRVGGIGKISRWGSRKARGDAESAAGAALDPPSRLGTVVPNKALDFGLWSIGIVRDHLQQCIRNPVYHYKVLCWL
jgi:hypothetical protein